MRLMVLLLVFSVLFSTFVIGATSTVIESDFIIEGPVVDVGSDVESSSVGKSSNSVLNALGVIVVVLFILLIAKRLVRVLGGMKFSEKRSLKRSSKRSKKRSSKTKKKKARKKK